MRNFLCALLALICFLSGAPASFADGIPALKKYAPALPGYKFRFPDDHRSHNNFKTEWWYYTGHLNSKDGKEFGFELTFFRSAVPIQDGVKSGPWRMDNIYMTHFALTDVQQKRFFHKEKLCRPGLTNAGADQLELNLRTENWTAARKDNAHYLSASDGDCAIKLRLEESRNPVIHGQNGVSQKASCLGCASHYYSFSRMPLKGEIISFGKKYEVEGIAWMDHEFGSNQLTSEQIGWDWYSIQLNDNSELMLYLMRLKNGKFDPNSSGTIVYADGKTKHLNLNAYVVDTTSFWKSSKTGAVYPSAWRIKIDDEKIDLKIEALVSDQELASDRSAISYWEGSCKVSGSKQGKPVAGRAYVELTGYDKEFKQKI
ncbi:MAG: hypothetical protein K2X27_23910 [Candidatus Obscuribacterales bacterium]|nr:hypothetical protein [Candidatus Obscuribacterales bacterium]